MLNDLLLILNFCHGISQGMMTTVNGLVAMNDWWVYLIPDVNPGWLSRGLKQPWKVANPRLTYQSTGSWRAFFGTNPSENLNCVVPSPNQKLASAMQETLRVFHISWQLNLGDEQWKDRGLMRWKFRFPPIVGNETRQSLDMTSSFGKTVGESPLIPEWSVPTFREKECPGNSCLLWSPSILAVPFRLQ